MAPCEGTRKIVNKIEPDLYQKSGLQWNSLHHKFILQKQNIEEPRILDISHFLQGKTTPRLVPLPLPHICYAPPPYSSIPSRTGHVQCTTNHHKFCTALGRILHPPVKCIIRTECQATFSVHVLRVHLVPQKGVHRTHYSYMSGTTHATNLVCVSSQIGRLHKYLYKSTCFIEVARTLSTLNITHKCEGSSSAAVLTSI